jgi:Family of unknown function (DUF6220)
MQGMRALFAVISWVFLGMVVIQVFLAGLGVFGAADIAMHVGFGYTVVYVPVLMLITCAAAQAGGRLVGLTAVLLLITFLQPILVYARDDIPIIAALHPLNALAITVLALVIARRATALAALPTLPTPETPELVLPEGWD